MIELYQMISAVVLTHNDEEILERCLASISWCDEMIVIDDHSTDETMAVAKKRGAKVFSRPLGDDFAAQRNFGLERAKGEWVLFVDSDEVVMDELAKEIRDLTQRVIPAKAGIQGIKAGSPIRSGMTDCGGYLIKRRDILWGKGLRYGETGNVKLLRFGRKDAGTWIQPVHEYWKIQGTVGELVHPLLHYPHQNVAQFLEEINRYSTLYARYLFQNGIQEPGWHIVGKPLAKFFVNYIYRLGILDGTAGITHALMMSFHSFLVRSKLWQLYDAGKNQKI
ncbi:glycosyltransferase family 2 protein [Candidatus Gottesmanbacteria bacterium]|nr:glycosyltransferase family 2 protein [Candidatus Gottesmanbacteria bacterium]